MTTALTLHDAARHALDQAVTFDEVKDIHDKAVALQKYAEQAQDPDLIDRATEFRFRAGIKAGKLLIEMADNGQRDSGKGGDRKSQSQSATVKLADLKISKSQSSRWQNLARLSADEQKAKIEQAKKKAIAAIDKRVVGEEAGATGQKERKAPALNAASWDAATANQRREFIVAIKPCAILTAAGVREFYRGLTEQQKDALSDEMNREWEARQINGGTGHP